MQVAYATAESGTIFSDQDRAAFSLASGDYNPLHVSPEYSSRTPYGQPVVFGMLGVIACLGRITLPPGWQITRLRADLLRPMFFNLEYRIKPSTVSDHEWSSTLYDGTTELVRLVIEAAPNPRKNYWLPRRPHFPRGEAIRRTESELVPGLGVSGKYDCDVAAIEALSARWKNADYPFVLATLCWSSYLIGMELPGESALFSRLHLMFERQQPSGELRYNAAIFSVDDRLGQIRIRASLTANDCNLASAELWSYTRPEPPPADLDVSVGTGLELANQVAIVIGASRGLGTAIKRALEVRGAAVYSVSRSDGGRNSECGSAADMAVLQRLRNRILAERGHLDILVCNAFPAILPLWLEPNAFERILEYVKTSLSLAVAPLCMFLDLLDARCGRVVVISSAAVERPVREWPHYIAAKQALEGISVVACKQYTHVSLLIVRPEKLLTAMTNTPLGRRGALSPGKLANRIADRLGHPLDPGIPIIMN
jgi:NAD(P)-dependent dehydrogenase (short-subunit alcohol dehydrogenase family)